MRSGDQSQLSITWRTARPGRLWCTQAVALQSAGEAAPSLSVVVLGGHDQHEVCSQSQLSIEMLQPITAQYRYLSPHGLEGAEVAGETGSVGAGVVVARLARV